MCTQALLSASHSLALALSLSSRNDVNDDVDAMW